MTTHRMGLLFALVREGLIVGILAAAVSGRLSIHQVFAALMVVAAAGIVIHFVVKCEACGKSVYYKEIFPGGAGRVINPIRGIPERQCSRCGADLEVQGERYGQ